MPTYEYRCRACGHGFDIVQSFKDESLTICPACGGELRKVFAPPAIAFKGSGFYATDSRTKSTAGSESKGDGSKGDGSKGDGSKDTKASKDAKQDGKKDASSSGGDRSGSSSATGSGSSSSGTKQGSSSS